MGTLIQDIRYGVRMLLKSPGFSLAAVLCLALGIGVNTTIFSVVSAMLIRPLPYPEPERVVALHQTQIKKGTEWNSVAPLNYLDWKAQSSSFEQIAAYHNRSFNVSEEENAEHLRGARASANLFTLLGIKPVLGRDFRAEEEQVGNDHVVLISDALWQRRFMSDPNVVGRTVQLDGDTYTIIGVMPPRFKFPNFAELWIPLALNLGRESRGGNYLEVVGRIKRGVTIAQAQEELSAVAARLGREFPATNEDTGARVRP